MRIPAFTCIKCDGLNPSINGNLLFVQNFSNDIHFEIRSVATECIWCKKQKILRVEE